MTARAKWVKVANVADIPDYSNLLRVVFEGEPVCIYQLENGDIYATQDLCTHGNASLSEGYLEEEVIECPLHQGTFNVVTGEALTLPCKLPLKTFKVKVEEGDIYLEGAA